MTDNREFDAKSFLRKSYELKDAGANPTQPDAIEIPDKKEGGSYLRKLLRPAGRVLLPIIRSLVRPLSVRIKKRLLTDLEGELSYFQFRQNRINQEVLNELTEIRKLLGEKPKNE